MSISNQMKADYVELANQYLDVIPVENIQEFQIVREALLSITEPEQSHEVAASLKERVISLKELIDQPELYVEAKENYNEFKKIILGRVVAKIKEIDGFSIKEKDDYIEQQKQLKLQSVENKKIMDKKTAPKEGTEAHVLSQEEWLRQLQEQSRSQYAFLSSPEYYFQRSDEIARELRNLTPQLQQFSSDSPDLLNLMSRGNSLLSEFIDLSALQERLRPRNPDFRVPYRTVPDWVT